MHWEFKMARETTKQRDARNWAKDMARENKAQREARLVLEREQSLQQEIKRKEIR
jgi:hypothetical protein